MAERWFGGGAIALDTVVTNGGSQTVDGSASGTLVESGGDQFPDCCCTDQPEWSIYAYVAQMQPMSHYYWKGWQRFSTPTARSSNVRRIPDDKTERKWGLSDVEANE